MMKPPIDFAEIERSGAAVFLREGTGARPVIDESYKPSSIEIRLPTRIELSGSSSIGISQFLYASDEVHCDWLVDALARIAQLSAGSDRAYAELALRQASHLSQTAPRIYNAPEGGVIIESRTGRGILTLLIEGPIGLIVRSADEFQVKAEFNITSSSINELLVRFLHELRLLFLPSEV